ncbi:hypothetical protein CN918_25580 [Priestia megaterium]|nr:hypothetical protein CN918_25580 [Priestia megaterium]
MLAHKEKIDQSSRGFCKYGNFPFSIGEKYTFKLENNQLIIEKVKEATNIKKVKVNTVSVKKLKSGRYPLFDIRTKEVKEFMSSMKDIELEVYEDRIIVSGLPKEDAEDEHNTSKSMLKELKKKATNTVAQTLDRFTKRIKNKKPAPKTANQNVIELEALRAQKKRIQIIVSHDDLKQAVGEMHQQLTIFDTFEEETPSVQKRFKQTVNKFIKITKKIGLKVSSLFSGIGMFNKPFVDAGFDMDFALEIDEAAVNNYKKNINSKIELADIMTFDLNKIKKNPIMLVSNPCTAWTKVNQSKTKWEDHPDYVLLDRTLDAIEANEAGQVVIWENVVEMFTAFGGKILKQIKERLKTYKDIAYDALFAPGHGSAQGRNRGYMILSKIGRIDLPKPTVSPGDYKTVREAFEGITPDMPNQKDYSNSKNITKERMRYIKQGRNWKDIPEHLRTERMLGEGKQSNAYYRYAYDSQSPSIVTDRKVVKFHPIYQRGLSIRELLRLFGMPDSFVLEGKINDMQQQVANGVDYHPAFAIAMKVLTHIMHVNQQNGYNQLVTV